MIIQKESLPMLNLYAGSISAFNALDRSEGLETQEQGNRKKCGLVTAFLVAASKHVLSEFFPKAAFLGVNIRIYDPKYPQADFVLGLDDTYGEEALPNKMLEHFAALLITPQDVVYLLDLSSHYATSKNMNTWVSYFYPEKKYEILGICPVQMEMSKAQVLFDEGKGIFSSSICLTVIDKTVDSLNNAIEVINLPLNLEIKRRSVFDKRYQESYQLENVSKLIIYFKRAMAELSKKDNPSACIY